MKVNKKNVQGKGKGEERGEGLDFRVLKRVKREILSVMELGEHVNMSLLC